MNSIDDIPWSQLRGGYRLPYDPRPALTNLDTSPTAAWGELWQELYHQGDVGEASYATVPFLVHAYRQRAVPDWNAYAIVATVELARDNPSNPPVPDWLLNPYQESIIELARYGLHELSQTNDPLLVRSILSVVALWKSARTYARMLIEFDESEITELEQQAFGNSVVG
jgi:hypothetical protein